jgi:hypothetical protein
MATRKLEHNSVTLFVFQLVGCAKKKNALLVISLKIPKWVSHPHKLTYP